MLNLDIIKERLLKNIHLAHMSKEIDDLINECIHDCLKNYRLVEKLEVLDLESNILHSNASFIINDKKCHEDLRGCQQVYVGLITLEHCSQKYIDSQRDDVLKLYFVNEIFNIILDLAMYELWCNLTSSLTENVGLTKVIAPGENEYSLELQTLIFDILKPEDAILDKSSLFVTPTKTITFMIGKGENIKTSHINERCLECNFPKCKKREQLIKVTIDKQSYHAHYGERLIDVFIKNHIPINSYCGGNHKCGKCKVKIKHNNHWEENLACETRCFEELEIETISSMNEIKIQESYFGIKHQSEIIHTHNNYGIAFDIGTTTIVGSLYNLGTNQLLGTLSEHNKQYLYGSDIISRINFTLNDADGLETLHDSILLQLNNLINKLMQNANINTLDKVVIVGNPTMISIVNKMDLKSLALYPYSSNVNNYIEGKANQFGLVTNALVTFIYGVSAFIGSDIVSGIVASKLYTKKEYQLLIDIGTNGEIALGNKDNIYTCSTAAGPAFEGATISCGVPSITGAIYQFDIDNTQVEYKTIDNKQPIGFCGSGIIDLTASFLNNHYIDSSGAFINEDYQQVNLDGVGFRFTQKDVREIQLAKSAIYTGIDLLKEKLGLQNEDIENIYISGGFGSGLNIDSAIRIGLIPSEFKSKVQFIGNSALYGASLFLLYDDLKKIFNDLKGTINFLDLTLDPKFSDLFIENLSFKLKE